MPITWGVSGVIIELILVWAGILVWEYWWWNFPHIYFILLWWTIPNLILAWLYDHIKLKEKKILAGVSLLFALSCHIVFAVILQWV